MFCTLCAVSLANFKWLLSFKQGPPALNCLFMGKHTSLVKNEPGPLSSQFRTNLNPNHSNKKLYLVENIQIHVFVYKIAQNNRQYKSLGRRCLFSILFLKCIFYAVYLASLKEHCSRGCGKIVSNRWQWYLFWGINDVREWSGIQAISTIWLPKQTITKTRAADMQTQTEQKVFLPFCFLHFLNNCFAARRNTRKVGGFWLSFDRWIFCFTTSIIICLILW